METRVSSSWPMIAAAEIPVLLMVATEPPELRERSEAAVPVFQEHVPQAEIHWIADAGHDLFADAGPRIALLIRDWAARIHSEEQSESDHEGP
jgi:pimeloyl-ACP methyl ester carboxylesterase